MNEAKEILLRVRRQSIYVRTLEDELNQIEIEAIQLKSPKIAEAVQSNHTADLAETVERLDEYARRVKEEVKRLIDFKKEAEELIKQVPQEDRRAILRQRYFLCYSWRKIANNIHYGLDHVNHLHKRTIDYLELFLQKSRIKQ